MTERVGGRAAAATLGRFGAWSFALQANPAAVAQSAVADLEAMGYGAVWIPESVGSKEAMSHAGLLLDGGERIVIATGIANIYARDPMAAANGCRTLAEAYPGRFVLGLGVSHAPSVAARGSTYASPVKTMRAYLDAMEAARYVGPEAPEPAPLLLAALGPRMLELAAERTDGAHPYFVPVEHTAMARSILGPEPCLAVEMTAVMETDPAEARRIARAFARHYLALPNYANNLRRIGYTDDDLAGEGSDRAIDAVIAWGDAVTIAERARQHLDAGADHVCIQLRAASSSDICLAQHRELTAILLR
jgi:probable F420-dependent oxidoreductase